MEYKCFKDFKGIIFDFDGTLADSLDVWADIDINFAKKRGLSLPKDYFLRVSAMNLPEAAVYTKEIYKLADTPEQIMNEWYEMAVMEYSQKVRFKPYALDFVKAIKNLGIKTAIATANEKELIFPCLKNNGAEDLFDAFAPTSAVSRAKGFPDVYDYAAKLLGLTAAECVVIEDIPAGVRGAKSGG